MLFIRANSLPLALDEGERLRLLDELASATGLTPLLRSTRRRLFRSLAPRGLDGEAASHAADEIERACASRPAPEGATGYTPGDLFFEADCALSLTFGEEQLSASVIYSLDTSGPLARLERFCRDVREALAKVRGEDEGGAGMSQTAARAEWRPRSGAPAQGLARFIAGQPADFVRAAAALRGGRELTRASELMEEPEVRAFLRRVQEMRSEGYTPRRLFAEAGTAPLQRMIEAGLLEREVRVSCRKSGHALFDLPTPDSLAAVTISRAKCSLCASPVADERIEETINPSRLAVSLLEDGRWLANRVYKVVRSLGVPDSEIASGPSTSHGESSLAADVCGNSFLFVTRDGDLTPAFCRRAAEAVEETEATHLVVVVTGSVEDEGRLRLYEFAWRRARAGQDLSATIVEGLASLRAEVERAFSQAVNRELSRSLFPLDPALGFSAASFVLNWFRLARRQADVKAAGQSAEGAPAPLFPQLDRPLAS